MTSNWRAQTFVSVIASAAFYWKEKVVTRQFLSYIAPTGWWSRWCWWKQQSHNICSLKRRSMSDWLCQFCILGIIKVEDLRCSSRKHCERWRCRWSGSGWTMVVLWMRQRAPSQGSGRGQSSKGGQPSNKTWKRQMKHRYRFYIIFI